MNDGRRKRAWAAIVVQLPSEEETRVASTRVALLFVSVISALLLLMLGRFAWHQLRGSDDNRQRFERRFSAKMSTDPAQWPLGMRPLRGTITDRKGRILAKSYYSCALILDPREIATPSRKDLQEWAREADPAARLERRRSLVTEYEGRILSAATEALHPIDAAARDELLRDLSTAFGLIRRTAEGLSMPLNPTIPLERLSRWSLVLGSIDPMQREAFIAALHRRRIYAFAIESRPVRSYPEGATSSQIVGLVATPESEQTATREPNSAEPSEGTGSGKRVEPKKLSGAMALSRAPVGIFGLEKAFESRLVGAPGFDAAQRDRRGRRYYNLDSEGRSACAGYDLELTIELPIQELAMRACRELHAKGGMRAVSAVVYDPNSGDVLAAATWPSFDPATDRGAKALEGITPRALTYRYEPGSVIKPLWWAHAFDHGFARPDDVWVCGGSDRVAHFSGRRVEDTSATPRPVDTEMAIILSKNTAVVELLVNRMGRLGTYEAVRALGFAHAPNLAFPGILGANFTDLSKQDDRGFARWTGPSFAQGYELELTPLQMAQYYGAFATAGVVREPRLVRRIREENGWHEVPERAPRSLFKAQTAARMREILGRVVDEGTAKSMRNSPYRIGAKTGTAVITKTKSRPLAQREYNLSLAAVAPLSRPEVVVTINIEGLARASAAGHSAGAVCGPLARQIIVETLQHLGIEPDQQSGISPQYSAR